MAKSKYYGTKTDNRPNDTDKMKYSPLVKYFPFSIIIKLIDFRGPILKCLLSSNVSLYICIIESNVQQSTSRNTDLDLIHKLW